MLENMSQEPDVIPFDWTPCDIIGELLGRSIYDVTDHILFYLDWASLKNVGLVSKRWRAAMMTALVRIVHKGNPNWSAEQLRSWSRYKSYVKNDFQVPVQDPCHIQCLANSVNLLIQHLGDEYCWPDLVSRPPKPEISLDYLPYLLNDAEDARIEHLCRVEMSDNFIIAWESSTRLFKSWSRRTLSPISMEQEFQMRMFPSIALDDVEKEFHLLGNDLYYVESSTSNPRENFAKVDLTKVDLDARRRGMDEAEEFKASVYVEPPRESDEMLVEYVNVIEDMVLLGFAVRNDGMRIEDSLTILWKLKRGETRVVLKGDTLQVRSFDEVFFDKDYLIVSWDYDPDEDVNEFLTYAILPPKDDANTVVLIHVASFEIFSRVDCDYKDGLLAYISVYGEMGLVDVSSGTVLKNFSTQMTSLFSGSNMIRLGRDLVICAESDEPDEQSVFKKGTTFHVWAWRSIMNQPDVEEKSINPVYKFTAFTSRVRNFSVDDLGVAAAIENDTAMGIQLLSFLPACSHCKRLTKPDLLTKCNVCKAAAYCSKECETADWFPHHEFICAKVDPLSFT